MKILFLTSMSLEREKNSGNKIHFSEVGMNLQKLGNQVVLVSPFYSESGTMESYGLTNEQITLPKKNISYFLRFHHLLLVRLAELIEKYQPDLIYSRDLLNVGKVTAAAHSRGIPHMIEINGLLREEKKHVQIKMLGFQIAQENSLSHYDLVRVMTKQQKETLVHRFHKDPADIFAIPQGTNPETFRDLGKESCREQLGLEKQALIFTFVGALNSARYFLGIRAFLESFKNFVKKYPNSLFRVVGNGSKKGKIQKLAEKKGILKNLEFTGYVPNTQVPIHISASDICLQVWVPEFPGKEELSIKLPSYMACERRVLVTDIPGFRDVTKSFQPLLWDYRDPSSMSHCLNQAREERASWDLGEAQRNFILGNFTWEATARKILDAFHSWKSRDAFLKETT